MSYKTLTCLGQSYVCLTDVSPTALELPVWTQVEDVLQRTDEILLELSVYRGATLQIRDVSPLSSSSLSVSLNFTGSFST